VMRAGADEIASADTVGYAHPAGVREAVRAAQDAVGARDEGGEFGRGHGVVSEGRTGGPGTGPASHSRASSEEEGACPAARRRGDARRSTAVTCRGPRRCHGSPGGSDRRWVRRSHWISLSPPSRGVRRALARQRPAPGVSRADGGS
ncbi:hypothetical protein OY671_009941, partial [Metschnikowia pulcherrima]